MGIDYGLGQTNIDRKTGIRYGVIPIYDVLQAWADSSEPEYPCDICEFEEGSDECEFCEPCGNHLSDKEYEACSDETDIFIIKSPYYTRADFCSPCAPGACHLRDHNPQGEKCYCFGHDWFENEKAPYPVFRIKDDKEIL